MSRVLMLCLLSVLITGCANKAANQQVSAFSSLGDAYMEAGRYEEAENYYQKAYALQSNKVDLMLKLADTQVQQDRFMQALETYKHVLVVDPSNYKVRYKLARVYMSQGNLEDALNQYDDILKSNSKDYQAFNGLGVLLDNISLFSSAQSCYQKGLSYAPNDFSLLNNLGVSYALSGNIVKARNDLELAGKLTATSRPKDNLELINHYYDQLTTPEKRQKALSNLLLLKVKTVTPSLSSRALSFSKKRCHP